MFQQDPPRMLPIRPRSGSTRAELAHNAEQTDLEALGFLKGLDGHAHGIGQQVATWHRDSRALAQHALSLTFLRFGEIFKEQNSLAFGGTKQSPGRSNSCHMNLGLKRRQLLTWVPPATEPRAQTLSERAPRKVRPGSEAAASCLPWLSSRRASWGSGSQVQRCLPTGPCPHPHQSSVFPTQFPSLSDLPITGLSSATSCLTAFAWRQSGPPS